MHKNQKGFTFVELLLAIAIIAVVAAICSMPWIAGHLWNSVMPELFGLKKITALQSFQLMAVISPFAVGALVLGSITFWGVVVVLTFCGRVLYSRWEDRKMKKQWKQQQRGSWHDRMN